MSPRSPVSWIKYSISLQQYVPVPSIIPLLRSSPQNWQAPLLAAFCCSITSSLLRLSRSVEVGCCCCPMYFNISGWIGTCSAPWCWNNFAILSDLRDLSEFNFDSNSSYDKSWKWTKLLKCIIQYNLLYFGRTIALGRGQSVKSHVFFYSKFSNTPAYLFQGNFNLILILILNSS